MIKKLIVRKVELRIETSLKKDSPLTFVLMHGLSNDMNDPLIDYVFQSIRKKYSVIRFNFSYADKGRDPDEKTDIGELRKVMQYAGSKNLILVGKSYGGYLSTFLASKENGVKGIISLGYPLYHKNTPKDMFQQKHLKKVETKSIFIMGQNDDRNNIKLFNKMFPKFETCVIKDVDHSFKNKRGVVTKTTKRQIVGIINNYLEKVL